MDLLTEKIRPMYIRYLSAAFGSAFITSIYGIVDMAMVGQYQGPEGTAAMAVVAPIWNIIYSLGLLMGIGGSVLFGTLRGQTGQNEKRSNEYFTAALIGALILSAVIWIGLIFFDKKLLILFGAEESLLPLARRYIVPVKFVVPCFLFTQVISAFLRNDGNPGLATRAVLFGGIFNIFGDFFFVFILNMGILGAGLATAFGAVLSLVIMLTHFWGKGNTLRLVKTEHLFTKLRVIGITGFSTFFIDVAMGILTILFNRQILKYLGTDALSVYGIIVNISTFVQCCAYSIGQASQPIISVNFGAGKSGRICETLRYALLTAAAFGIFWIVLSLAAPNLYVRIFMAPTEKILEIAPAIIRSYGLSFLLLPLNVFSTFYFQALMRPGVSFVVSVSRGALISGAFILLLPGLFGSNSIWFAMPFTEFFVTIYVTIQMVRCTKRILGDHDIK
ncbi:MAG: multidrug transporter MatE [Lachnospiraceae bacterium]|nr:multidrug transporter MatE [Lachnospiraceae bacterium]